MKEKFIITKEFSDDLKQFDAETCRSVSKAYRNYRSARPHRINGLKYGLHTSLYSLQANHKTRLYFTVDDDPIFGTKNITLLRVTNGVDDPKVVIHSIANKLYAGFLK